MRCEAHRDQADEAQRELARQASERLECAPDAILAAVGIAADEVLPPLADATQRWERLTRERDTMGPVNLVAETEAQEVEERLQMLTAERDDLVAAIAKLRQGIQTLNREGRERLHCRLRPGRRAFPPALHAGFSAAAMRFSASITARATIRSRRGWKSWRARRAKSFRCCRCSRAASRR